MNLLRAIESATSTMNPSKNLNILYASFNQHTEQSTLWVVDARRFYMEGGTTTQVTDNSTAGSLAEVLT